MGKNGVLKNGKLGYITGEVTPFYSARQIKQLAECVNKAITYINDLEERIKVLENKIEAYESEDSE